jgi:ABC-type enterobactin transport system permease subunit
MKHFPAGLFTGAVIAAVVYSDGAHPVTALVVGGLVAVGVWVLAYATDRRH